MMYSTREDIMVHPSHKDFLHHPQEMSFSQDYLKINEVLLEFRHAMEIIKMMRANALEQSVMKKSVLFLFDSELVNKNLGQGLRLSFSLLLSFLD